MRALVSLQMQGMPRAFEAFPAFFIWRSGARTFFQKNGDPFSHLFLCFFEHRSIHQIAAEGIGRALPLLFERRAGCTGEERVDLPFVFGGIHGAGDVGEVPAGRQVRPHGIEDAALEVDQPGYLPGGAERAQVRVPGKRAEAAARDIKQDGPGRAPQSRFGRRGAEQRRSLEHKALGVVPHAPQPGLVRIAGGEDGHAQLNERERLAAASGAGVPHGAFPARLSIQIIVNDKKNK